MEPTKVASAFHIDRTWLYRLQKIFEKEGYEGIFNLKKGAKPKICQEIVDFIKYKYKIIYEQNGDAGFRDVIIEAVKKEFQKDISYETLRKILKPYKSDIQNQVKAEKSQDGNENIGEAEGSEPLELEKEKEPSPEIEKKESFIQKQPVFNRYAGLLLLNPFIKNISIIEKFKEILSGGFEKIKKIIIIVIYMISLSKYKIENYKELVHNEFNQIANSKKFTYPENIRRQLREHITFEEMMEVQRSMLKHYITNEEMKKHWLFIDGHVIKYYGKRKILKMYHQQSNTAVSGRVQYYIYTYDGKPVYFEINDGYNDFREEINKLIGEIKNVVGDKYKDYLYINQI